MTTGRWPAASCSTRTAAARRCTCWASDAPTTSSWLAGDLVEVLPRNCPWAIEHFLDGLGIDGRATVELDGLVATLEQALASRQLPENRTHLVGLHAQALVDALVPLAMREYSIASIAADGVLELIVRQELHPDGSLGVGSGWLTEHAPVGSAISLRVRRNSGFHLPAEPVPMILLGNGTGLAGSAQPAQGADCRRPATSLAAVRRAQSRARLPVPRRAWKSG